MRENLRKMLLAMVSRHLRVVLGKLKNLPTQYADPNRHLRAKQQNDCAETQDDTLLSLA